MSRWKDFTDMLVRKLKIRRGQAAFTTRYVPATATLVLVTFAPSVTGSIHLDVVPTPASLTITERVPTVSTTSDNAILVTPTTRALATVKFAPTVTRTNQQRVTPTTRALVITRRVPTVTPTAPQTVTSAKRTLTLTKHAPNVNVSSTGLNFYMAPGGSDAAAGTIGAPWASIQKFINTNPAAGSTLYLRNGNYTLSQGGHTGDGVGDLIGTASQPITIRNYPGEVPVFPNMPSPTITLRGNFSGSTVGANYVVLDGIRFTGCSPDDAAVVVIGNAGSLAATAYLVKNITIRRCFFSLAAGLTNRDHPTGLVHGCENITFEDCEFQGPGVGGLGGDAIVAYSQPAARNILIQRCIFHDWYWKAVQVWDYNTAAPTATFQFKHCTFKNNIDFDIDLRYHSTSLIQDCVFDGPNTASTIYDPLFPGATTRDHNYFNQVLTGSYGLTAGSAAINGAHDGTDAGAVPYP